MSVYTPWYLGITETPEGYYRPGPLQGQLSLEHHFDPPPDTWDRNAKRSEEHTSELQSHSFISYAVFCLKKKRYNI